VHPGLHVGEAARVGAHLQASDGDATADPGVVGVELQRARLRLRGVEGRRLEGGVEALPGVRGELVGGDALLGVGVERDRGAPLDRPDAAAGQLTVVALAERVPLDRVAEGVLVGGPAHLPDEPADAVLVEPVPPVIELVAGADVEGVGEHPSTQRRLELDVQVGVVGDVGGDLVLQQLHCGEVLVDEVLEQHTRPEDVAAPLTQGDGDGRRAGLGPRVHGDLALALGWRLDGGQLDAAARREHGRAVDVVGVVRHRLVDRVDQVVAARLVRPGALHRGGDRPRHLPARLSDADAGDRGQGTRALEDVGAEAAASADEAGAADPDGTQVHAAGRDDDAATRDEGHGARDHPSSEIEVEREREFAGARAVLVVGRVGAVGRVGVAARVGGDGQRVRLAG
jgi:hypothetical protein